MINKKTFFIGIDLGGTAIKIALVDQDGRIIDKTEASTPKNGSAAVIEKMHQMMKQITSHNQIEFQTINGIGIGVPGFVDLSRGYIYELVNLGWKDVPLKQHLQQQTGLPVFVENDANAAALGEMWTGAGEGAKYLVMVTLGTGIGGGVVINGEVLHGANGMAGEIGHIAMLPEEGPPCNCGKTGCLETLSSASAVARMGRQAAEDGSSPALQALYKGNGTISARDVVEAAAQGDQAALDIISKSAYYLGLGLSHIANSINPDKIVIGGGLSKAGDILFDPVKESFALFSLNRVNEACEIVPAQLGNDAGVVGAAWVAKVSQGA